MRYLLCMWEVRSSGPPINTGIRSIKKDFIKNFAKIAGKPLCQSLFFNKAATLRPATLLIKRLWRKCFSVKFVKFVRTPFYRTPPDDCFCTIHIAIFLYPCLIQLSNTSLALKCKGSLIILVCSLLLTSIPPPYVF